MAGCKILFLGTRPLGKRVLEFLLTQSDVEIVGVIEPEDTDCYWKENLSSLNVPIISSNDLSSIDCDLVVSVNYNKILKEPLLSSTRLGCVNLHHSYNLRLRGRHSATHAILLARPTNTWEHGSTLHYMSAELDAGKIIASASTPIKEEDTAFTLFYRCEDLAMDLIKDHLPKIWRGGVKAYEPSKEFHSFKKKSLPSKEVNLLLSPLEIYDYVRALTFPPFERPYMLVGDQMFFLTIEKTNRLLLNIDESRSVYIMENQ